MCYFQFWNPFHQLSCQSRFYKNENLKKNKINLVCSVCFVLSLWFRKDKNSARTINIHFISQTAFSPIFFLKFNNENCCAMQKPRKELFWTSGLLDLRNNVNSGTDVHQFNLSWWKKIFNENINTVCKRKNKTLSVFGVCTACDFKTVITSIEN